MAKTHKNIKGSMCRVWGEMLQDDLLTGDFERVSLLDLVLFLANVERWRRQKKRSWSEMAKQLINQLIEAMIRFLASCIKIVVMEVCQNVPDIDTRSIPARRQRQSASSSQAEAQPSSPSNALVPVSAGGDHEVEATKSRKSKVQVDLNTIWDLHQDSLDTGVSLALLARTRQKDKSAGMSETSVLYWTRKIETMYSERATVSMRALRFYNMACDASRHSTRDTLASTL